MRNMSVCGIELNGLIFRSYRDLIHETSIFQECTGVIVNDYDLFDTQELQEIKSRSRKACLFILLHSGIIVETK